MAVSAMDWPIALPPWKVDFFVDQPSRSGGASLTGSEQIIVSNAGRWRASVTLTVRGEAANLALRAMVASLEGRAGTILVPVWERFRSKDMDGRTLSPASGVGYSCSDYNFDVTGFGQSDAVFAQMAVNASAGATQISVDLVDGEGPRPGHFFGIADRIHRCAAVWQEEEGDPTQIRFWPRLRAAALAGATVILDRPVCLMRFQDDAAGDVALSRAQSGVVKLDFVEAI